MANAMVHADDDADNTPGSACRQSLDDDQPSLATLDTAAVLMDDDEESLTSPKHKKSKVK